MSKIFAPHRGGGEFDGLSDAEMSDRFGWYFDQLDQRVIPNMRRLQQSCRRAGIEVLYTTIESLTRDGRDRSLDYKITGFHVPKGSWDGKVIEQLAPLEDEIRLAKSFVFRLRIHSYRLSATNLGVRQLVVSGL